MYSCSHWAVSMNFDVTVRTTRTRTRALITWPALRDRPYPAGYPIPVPVPGPRAILCTQKNGCVFPPRSSRPTAFSSPERATHGHDNRRWSLRQRGGGGDTRSQMRSQENTRNLSRPPPDSKRVDSKGFSRIRAGVPTDEHPPPPAHRPVPGSVLLAGLAAARASDGATADQPPRDTGPRTAAQDQALHPRGPETLRPARRGPRHVLPAQPLPSTDHPSRPVRQECAPEFRHVGQDSGPGRGSHCAQPEGSHHDQGPRGLHLHASRGTGGRVEVRRHHRHLLSRYSGHFHPLANLPQASLGHVHG